MTFGEKLRQLRNEKGITQNELAEKLFVTFQTVSKWENDVNQPDIPTLKQIAQIFNCSIDSLLDVDVKDSQNEIIKCSLCSKQILAKENKHQVTRKDSSGNEMKLVLCDSCYSKIQNQEDPIQPVINIFPTGIQNNSEQSSLPQPVELPKDDSSKPIFSDVEEVKNKTNTATTIKVKEGKHRLSNRNDKVPLIWSIVVGVIALIVVIIISAVLGKFSGATIGIALGVGYTTTATVYCIFSASYISDVFLEISSWTIKFPGLIFSWDLEGFVWLIGMKILFAVLGFLGAVAITALAIAISALLSIFSFIPVLISNRQSI